MRQMKNRITHEVRQEEPLMDTREWEPLPPEPKTPCTLTIEKFLLRREQREKWYYKFWHWAPRDTWTRQKDELILRPRLEEGRAD